MNTKNIFEPQQETTAIPLQDKIQTLYGKKESYNPFLDKAGRVFNKYIDYQGALDNPNITDAAKKYISQATGLKPTVQNTKIKSFATEVPAAKNEPGKLGFVSAKYEAGGYNGGNISSGNGDYGGVSYGIPQFSTTTGSADKFISWLKEQNPEIGGYFADYKAGSNEFSNAWKQAYEKYGDTFTNYQTQYAYDSFVSPLVKLAKQKTGVDYTRSPALQELIYSTAIQFGGGSLGLAALGNVRAGMSDDEIINASYDNKISNYKNYFKSSSQAVQESVKNRFENERKDILGLLNNETSYISPKYEVGKKIAATHNYSDGLTGECVWYVRGRAKEKMGVDTGIYGNANTWYGKAKKSARLSANSTSIKPNTVACYAKGQTGSQYGHVIYIEGVDGDNVYYTEGGQYYHKRGTDGTVKKASRAEILNMCGGSLQGFIDLTAYNKKG